jgi:hypothetical protein
MPLRNQFNTDEEWLAHLRLWFAGQALPALVDLMEKQADIPSVAYSLADAMIAERSK